MDEAHSYVHKWLERQPEMALAPVFAGTHRQLLPLWGALLHELDSALYGIEEPSVQQAKLAWWGEELERGSRGEARHPLVRALFAALPAERPADPGWPALAFGALQVATQEDRPATVAGLLEQQQPYAQAVARIESALFGGGDASRAVAIERVLLALQAGTLRWPLILMARHQVGEGALHQHPRPPAVRALVCDLATQLGAELPPDEGGLFRRARHAITRRQLQALARGRELRLGGFALPWLFWRAARAAARTPA